MLGVAVNGVARKLRALVHRDLRAAGAGREPVDMRFLRDAARRARPSAGGALRPRSAVLHLSSAPRAALRGRHSEGRNGVRPRRGARADRRQDRGDAARPGPVARVSGGPRARGGSARRVRPQPRAALPLLRGRTLRDLAPPRRAVRGVQLQVRPRRDRIRTLEPRRHRLQRRRAGTGRLAAAAARPPRTGLRRAAARARRCRGVRPRLGRMVGAGGGVFPRVGAVDRAALLGRGSGDRRQPLRRSDARSSRARTRSRLPVRSACARRARTAAYRSICSKCRRRSPPGWSTSTRHGSRTSDSTISSRAA